MEQMSILTPEQKLIFDQIRKSDFIRSNFYFTGGTALAEFYLKHRYSEDLDFFSENEFSSQQIRLEISRMAKEVDFTFKSRQQGFVHFYMFYFKDKPGLKVDFGYYPPKRIEKGQIFKQLAVDSLLDIAINKFVAFHQRSTSKDLVDLFFLLKKLTVWDLIEGARVKFNLETDPWLLSSDLAYAVENMGVLPKLIKTLKRDQLEKFFLDLAKSLGRKAVK